jgi:hypothetical protein
MIRQHFAGIVARTQTRKTNGWGMRSLGRFGNASARDVTTVVAVSTIVQSEFANDRSFLCH